jgi:hypothetical protein
MAGFGVTTLGRIWVTPEAMTTTRQLRLQKLADQFNALAHSLSGCRDPVKRREYFRKMKAVVQEVDEMIFNEHPKSDSKANGARPVAADH